MTDDSVADDEQEQDRDESPSEIDETLSLLSDRYRRHALACLDGQPEPVPIERLTDEVAGREFQQPPDQVSMITRTEIATALHHNHLPKLEQAGIIVYDSNDGEVTKINIKAPLTSFLDQVRRHEG
ncbi:DUF7344 domain-containing protein [Halorussus halophilus]|uniref:DUF7344 domain-containing protein n=1 Tax=Halorussus halophilus TaxID=2650975 RepID=UPI0013011CFF|nr:hypothetical protein [Halorussus halophilus]